MLVDERISEVKAYLLENVPISPPPFRELPNTGNGLVVRVATNSGRIGWAFGGAANPTISHFINGTLAEACVGESALRPELLWRKVNDSRPEGKFGKRRFGPILDLAMSAVDVALWDIKAQAANMPLHVLLGGARDTVPIYVTHGAAYGKAPVYSREDLAQEAAHLVGLGNTFLKNTVGRQLKDGEFAPDPVDDFHRMTAMREAVGPGIRIAMDANSRMSRAGALQLCRLVEDLNIAFFEEPVVDNRPQDMALIRNQTSVPIASAQNHRYGLIDLIQSKAIDFAQPNVSKDGGFSGAIRLAGLAAEAGVPLAHGNGGGLHNIALHAAIPNGATVEYHFHHWMLWNVVFAGVPQPVEGVVTLSQEAGSGLYANMDVLHEYAV